MNWPGENLIIKLWETLAEKGVGSLLKPWQTRRDGAAQVDVRRYEMLALAQAEREAEEIRSGKKSISESSFTFSLTENKTTEQPTSTSITKILIADTIRKEANTSKAILHAEDELKNDPSPPPENKIDSDWLYRWREYSSNVSTEELQALWGKILAGEIKAPGSHSYRLLEFIKNLTSAEASIIEKASPFIINNSFLPRDNDGLLANEGITFGTLLKLQELGIISGVESLGLQLTFESTDSIKYIRILMCHGKGILIKHDDRIKKLSVQCYILTDLGKQLISLGKFTPIEKYLESYGRIIKKQGYITSLIDYSKINGNMLHYFNEKPIE